MDLALHNPSFYSSDETMKLTPKFPDLSVPPHILAIKPYEPGKPIEELEREYGIPGSVKLASNENPLGPSPAALAAMQEAIGSLHRYPDGGAFELTRILSRHLGVPPEMIVFGNGSDELIGLLCHALLMPGDEVVLPRPSFLIYDIMARSVGAKPVAVPLKSLSIDLDGVLDAVTPETRMVFINNPNNPTGTIIQKDAFERFLQALPPRVMVVVDEAYIDFVRDGSCAIGTDYLDGPNPMAVLRTFSKAYGLAGLRIGYGVMHEEIRSLINRIRMPFNASTLAQVAAGAAIQDAAFIEKTCRVVHDGLDFLFDALAAVGLACFPTQSNFFLIDMKQDAGEVFEKMLRQGIIVRSMASYGYPEYIRVNVGLPEENKRLVEALTKIVTSEA
jgi:histidinol-phosphate aminotransferase